MISKYSKTGSTGASSDDGMGEMVQILRAVYAEIGQRGNWRVDVPTGRSSCTLLTGNDEIRKHRANERFSLSKIYRSKLRSRTLSMFLVCEHLLGTGLKKKGLNRKMTIVMYTTFNHGSRIKYRCKF